MCRGKDSCYLLGTNKNLWSKEILLKIPDEYLQGLEIFVEAVDLFLKGKKTECIALINSIDGAAMWEWYVEHGQMSGKHRNSLLQVPRPVFDGEKYEIRAPTKFEREVFSRDGYRCRYCGVKVLSKQFVRKFIQSLNYDGLRKVKGNVGTHGLFLLFWPVADHVVPHSLGGHTNLENLVTSCGPCNYGKQEFTVEQLGIRNPFKNYKTEDWDGLVGLKEILRKKLEDELSIG